MFYFRGRTDFSGGCFHHHHQYAFARHGFSGDLFERTDNRKKVLGIAVGATGALLLILGSHQVSEAKAAGNHYIWGDLLVLLAQFSYALYFVLFKNFVNKYSLITIMKWMFTYAFICALPFSYNDLLHTEWKSLQNTEIGALVFIVVGSTFISYVLIVIGQKIYARLLPVCIIMFSLWWLVLLLCVGGWILLIL